MNLRQGCSSPKVIHRNVIREGIQGVVNAYEQQQKRRPRRKDKMFRGAVAPQFFMSNESEARVPHLHQQAVFKMTEAVTCTKCKHQHLLEPPSLEMSVADLESVKVSAAVA